MKKRKTLLAILATLTLMSFIVPKPLKTATVKVGTFSTCSCESATESELKFGLSLHADFSFHYFNYSNESKKIDIDGNWSQNGNTILLKNYPKDAVIDNKWVIDNDGKCLKSRKGLLFTRLCNVDYCK